MLLALFSSPSIAQITLPANMYADSAYAPFYWGVASGDPLPDGIVLWTKVPAPEVPVIPVLTWQISTDSTFATIEGTGTVSAFSMSDHCVRAEVDSLEPATTYYYRFLDMSGQSSQLGRTKTAPVGPTDQLKIAVASCSSIYSGFFNAYRRISEIDDLDLMIHLGDYIYNTVDSDEQIRLPDPYPQDPENLQEWRDRHAYYLLDPDLRAARQNHPWVNIWDNHDFGDGTEGGIQAFWEYVPRRNVHNNTGKCHRSFEYGDLVDLIMIDIEKFRDEDEIAPGEPSVLGNEQYDWFVNELESADAQWKIIGNQKMFGGWSSEGVPEWLPIPNSGGVFDDGSWDGYMAERDSILGMIEDQEIDNVMVLSGDVHMSFAMDLSRNFVDSTIYDPISGDGSLGVEFIATSVSRGNMDEAGFGALVELAIPASNNINPHHQFVNFIDHGYGLLTINSDSIKAEFHYCPKLEINTQDSIGKTMVVLDGDNHWKREIGTSIFELGKNGRNNLKLYPNPAGDFLTIELAEATFMVFEIKVIDATGRTVISQDITNSGVQKLDISDLINGIYLIEAQVDNSIYRKPFVKSK